METEMDTHYEIPYGNNGYCGPTALAYLTRSDPDTAAKLLREVTGKRAIRGAHNRWMLAALDRKQIRVFPVVLEARTLRQWWEKWKNTPGEFLINITGHYIVIHNGKYFDNRCHLGKPMESCPYLRHHVKLVWRRAPQGM